MVDTKQREIQQKKEGKKSSRNPVYSSIKQVSISIGINVANKLIIFIFIIVIIEFEFDSIGQIQRRQSHFQAHSNSNGIQSKSFE